MSLLRAAMGMLQLRRLRSAHTQSVFPIFARDSIRHFSTESETPQQQQPQDSTPIDPFLRPPSSGLTYGRLTGICTHTLRTDIINLFDSCNLTMDDVKVIYNAMFNPLAFLVQFPSLSVYGEAGRLISKKRPMCRLEKIDRSFWDQTKPYNGIHVLMQGIPRTAAMDDVQRFLSGCDYDSSSLEMFTRASQPEPIRMGIVRFPSQVEAMNAAIRKNRSYCQNNQVLVRVLQ